MQIIHLLCAFTALFGVAVLQDLRDRCYVNRNCGDCIRAAGCQWCADSNFNAGSQNRCFQKGKTPCEPKHIYPKRNPNQHKIKQDKPFGDEILFRPQQVHLKLHVGEEYRLNITYKHAHDYPVDLYYLMDLSASMEDDKDSLSELGEDLARVMRNLTKDFRLGFGSFVDKVAMPYVSTVPEKLEKPCFLKKTNLPCAPPYGFKNHLKLDTNISLFSMKVKEAKVSGNLDAPEGGFDAIMQAIVCQKQIGWRQKVRHLLVFSTDAEFHFAGDGRLAGLIEPNDMKCYVTDDGNYTASLKFDYPSISQINKVVKEYNINLIFAVIKIVSKQYKNLAESITGAAFGVLTDDSSNVVQLVRDEYEKILGNIELTATGNRGYVDVHFNSSCIGKDWKETHICEGLHQGSEVNFTATIKVLQCPDNNKNLTVHIKPTALEDNITITLEIDCDCPCERPDSEGYEKKSDNCSKHGNLQCGICECIDDWYGDKCQCQKNSEIPVHLNDNACKMNNNTPICSERGKCECGICMCDTYKNSNERYGGKFCECDKYTCQRYGDLPCSGPEHGECECGMCVCNWDWTGEACECPSSSEGCMQPSSSKVCTDRGSCECGACKCLENYAGKYCEEYRSGPGQQCEKYRNVVECRVFESGPLSKDDCFKDKRIVIEQVDIIEEPEKVEEDSLLRVCRIPDNAGCTFLFRYMIGNATLQVQRTKECGSNVDILALVLGVIGGIVLLGLLCLLIWKIVTSIHDRREYAKFEKERAMSKWDRGDNPFYKPATSTFNNPTFGGD